MEQLIIDYYNTNETYINTIKATPNDMLKLLYEIANGMPYEVIFKLNLSTHKTSMHIYTV